MPVTLRETLPPADPLAALLRSGTPESRALFPGGHFASDAHLARRLAHLDGARRAGGAPSALPAPKAVQSLLQGENAFAPLHAAQELALDLAGKHGTVFLLTGQQPGLLGGPVLWLYKALSAIALAEASTRRLGRPVLPVFWVAGDDSDLAECNHLELLEEPPDGLPSVLGLPFADPGRALPVASRPVEPAALEGLFTTLARVWTPATVAAARAAFGTSSAASSARCGSLADAFLRLAQDWLGPRGMLFLRGHSPAVRAAARPALERAVRERRGLDAALRRGTAALAAAGYEAQVPLRAGAVHAFVLEGGERRRLLAEAGETAGTSDRLYTVERPGADLAPALASLELTHDALSRPLAAESLLPVLGHVLGPAELRYFAQLSQAFLDWTGDMPLVHPRMSAAVLPEAAAAAFAREGLSLAEAAALKPSALRARLVDKAWKAHPAAAELPSAPPRELADGLARAHRRHFRDTGPLERLERTLAGSWKRYLRSLGRLAYSERADGDAALFRHLRWLANGSGQDRHLNLFSLLDAVGPRGVEELIAAANPAEPGLRIFTWGGEGERA